MNNNNISSNNPSSVSSNYHQSLQINRTNENPLNVDETSVEV